MTTAFVPYRLRPDYPQTTDLRALRAEVTRCRETYGRGSDEGLEAFQRLCRESYAQGRPIDGLRGHVADETERFFSMTIAGPDGHTYWDGPKSFFRNDGRRRTPARWWWERRHGPFVPGDARMVRPSCGDANCITVGHQELVHAGTLRQMRDETMLGTLQVAAMRLGHTPSSYEWKALEMHPVVESYQNRFGSWTSAIRAAGLTPGPRVHKETTREDCVATVRAMYVFLQRRPTTKDLRHNPALNSALKAAGLPTASSTIKRHCGSWGEALTVAGI